MELISIDEVIRILTFAEQDGTISGNVDLVIEEILSEITR